jgi:DNA polymerase elongation subunit (family B)
LIQKWSNAELELITKYFNTTWNHLTLFQKIHDLNSLRTYESVTRELRRWKARGWTKKRDDARKKLRVGYFDIEATNLNANFGFMLSWYIKKAKKNEYDFSVINKKEIFNYEFDRRLVKELFDAFENYDVIYTHWGALKRFDIPFIITRAYAHGLEKRLSILKDIFIRDTWPIARTRMRLHRNSLEAIGDAVCIKGVKKTPLAPERWRLAGVGHPKALEYIALHNKRDVQLLEKIHRKLEAVERKQFTTV